MSTITTCSEDSLTTNEELTDIEISLKKATNKPLKATGGIEFTWNEETESNRPENSRGFLDVTAKEATEDQLAKGEIYYLITLEDKTVHREIYANVISVTQDGDESENGNKAYIIAQVVFDSKEKTADTEVDQDFHATHEESEDEEGEGSIHDITNGKYSRVGQYIGIKIRDGGSHGAGNDKISWKWFSPDNKPETSDIPGFGNDRKTVISGNLTIHL